MKPENYRTREQALAEMIRYCRRKVRTEWVPVREAAGRIAAEEIRSRNTLPVCRSAQVDGTFVIVPEEPIVPGQLVSGRGSSLKEGECLVRKGQRITPLTASSLARGGILKVPVQAKLRVAYLPTGDELIRPEEKPERGKNIETNSILVRGFLEAWGAELVEYEICRDRKEELEAALTDAWRQADLILVNGGSSRGSEDYNAELIGAKAEWMQHGIRSIPGVPTALAVIDGKPVINLPGPPFAAFAVLDWCVRPWLIWAQGSEGPASAWKRTKQAVLTKAVRKPEGMALYVRFRLREEKGVCLAEPCGWNCRFAEAMGAGAYAALPEAGEGLGAGSCLEVTVL